MYLLFFRLRRILKWFPILWHDEDWDYAYLLKILKFKLSLMENVVGNKASHAAHWEHRKVEIATAQLLLAKIEDDPDDEWKIWYNTHLTEDINEPLTPDKRKALDASHHREERNWKNLWRYLEKNMRNWWD